ncbi:MAG: ABC transporter substrate-binding protein [Pseudorhodoplanes sp.]
MRRSLSLALILASAILGITMPSGMALASPAKLKMILNWKYQGPQGWFFLAQDRGYFAAEGIDIEMTQGNGSGAAVPMVANGTYDVGFGDINALIELAARKPDIAPLAVYVMYNTPPFSVVVKQDSPIKEPKDLIGKTIGGGANDAVRKLFPAFCGYAKIDCDKINIMTIQPGIYEQMLMRGQVDAVFGYVNTVRFSAKLINIDPDKELRFIRFIDYGMDLYSNSIIVSKKLVKERPEVVKGLVRAINRGLTDALNDPAAAIAAVEKREPLIKAGVERERLDSTVAREMSHPEIATVGFGNVDQQRLQKSIETIVKALELPRTPAIEEVFSPDFLPPPAERITKLSNPS